VIGERTLAVNARTATLSSRARRAIAAFLVALLATGASAVAAPRALADSDGPGNGSPVNTAVVENTKDGSSLFRLAFQVRSITNAATVAPGNVAIALASCTDCQTVAIAVQVVFFVGSPTTFTPENGAVAVNTDCSYCDTLATAYQFIVQSSVPVRLTAEGKHDLHDVRKALADLNGSGLTGAEMQTQVDQLMDQLASVLGTEVEPIPGQRSGQSSDSSDAAPDASQSPVSSTSSTSTTIAITATTSTSTSESTTTTTQSSTSSSSLSSSPSP